jgi:hypothetical protein
LKANRPRDEFDFGDDYDFWLFVREETVVLYLSGAPVSVRARG